MNSWKSFMADITVQNVWKKNSYSWIEDCSGHFISSFKGIIDAVLRKFFPCDLNCQDSQHRILHSEAELVYESDDDVPFSKIRNQLCVIDNLSLNKSSGSGRFNNELIKKFHIVLLLSSWHR
ncbi:hypothetical protein TNCV_2497581 [Trichonephila clavipes]|nr:hypothetical protein TNCV_2497581 [Trichonephila clavipes]